MASWHHRNPLKSTSHVSFNVPLSIAKADAVQICDDLCKFRTELLKLLTDPLSNEIEVEKLFNDYISLLLGLVGTQSESNDGKIKLRYLLTFKWNHSVIGGKLVALQDSVFEFISIFQEYGIWLMKHASVLVSTEETSDEQAKIVYKSLKKAAGIFKFVEDNYFKRLNQEPSPGSDLDPNISKAYIHQCIAEAQEVTVARAIELKHSASLISSLCDETSKNFQNGYNVLKEINISNLEKWKKYFCLKSTFYKAYAYCYNGQNLLELEKCGEAINSLKECCTLIEQMMKLCKEYSKAKGVGSMGKIETHSAFLKMISHCKRMKEKCERENSLIFHQKIPLEITILNNKASHGIVNIEEYKLPQIHSLWNIDSYACFEMMPKTNLKPNKKEEILNEMREKKTDKKQTSSKTESGCILQ